MKTKLIILLAMSWAMFAPAQTAGTFITQGTNDLALETSPGLWAANTNFAYAVTLSPTNETANTLWALTRLLVLPQTPAGSNFLNGLNIPSAGRNIYNWTAKQPVDVNGKTVWPANYNSTNFVAFYRTNIMSVLAASATNLANVKSSGFTLTLLASETAIGKFTGEDVTLDYGDIQMLRALVAAAQFAGYTVNAQNAGVVIPTLQKMSATNGLTLQSLLAAYPSLLTLSSAADLTSSKGALTNAIAYYFAASDFIRNVRLSGVVGLFNLGPDEAAQEALFRTQLTNVLLSLNGPVQVNPPSFVTVNTSNYFSGAKTLRSLTPQFSGDAYVNDSLPDYTFGGILGNDPAYLTELALRKEFHSYAGIYGGQVDDIFYGDPGAGDFAVFVSTNQQATVVGYDTDSFQYINGGQAGGVAAQFTVDKHGNWLFASNNLDGVISDTSYGWIGKDGSLSGELDFTNGDSVWLNGYAQPAAGPFQNAAGNYSGSGSGTFGGHSTSFTLSAVLSATGDIIYCVFVSGAENDGGEGQFGSNNKFTNSASASGSTVIGTLNNSTFQITGSVANSDGSGSWTMSRSASVPFEVPPAITANLPPTLSAPLGTNVTFSLVVTGSPPMCFQWYDNNDNPIPGATTNKLVLSNLLYSAAGTYSVAINNCAGGTNAAVTLTVTAETTPPTDQITAPTAGLSVSNASYTITGKAGDNVAVSNVWVQLNSSGWNPVASFDGTNWAQPVTLSVPGPNTVKSFAMDTSGNVSTTNTVNFTYVIAAPLTVQMYGKGTVSPNDSNALLQVGSAYSMTAAVVSGSGFVFSNWTGGTTLPLAFLTNGTTVNFVMASNLVLQANFLDTNRPTLAITAPTAGQRWSNQTFTASGTAADNWQVAGVQYQLNGGLWTNAQGSNTWSAVLNLVPGTNLFAAYAVDTTGNHSTPTNSVSLDYVVTNQLGVITLGLGTVSPNYSNAWLEIGRNYSITSAPASGFIFTNWLVATNWIGGATVAGTNLHFMMASNLTLQATFVETSKPSITITTPTNLQKMTNALAAFTGTASDKWQVAGLWYQVNSNAWSLVSTTNSYTNWTKTVTLLAGTNTLKAYAQNLGGNFSATNTLSVISSNTFNLQLAFTNTQPMKTNGLVFNLQLSPGLNGRIQVTTNLGGGWVTLTNFAGGSTNITVTDPAATNAAQRFYRAVIP